MNVSILDHKTLESNLKNLLSNERRIQAQFLVHLAEFDRRNLYETHGYASLWDYCVRSLNLSENQTSYRTRSVAVLQTCPEAVRYLEDGRICMTVLADLKPVITKENCTELLSRVAHKTRGEAHVIIATLRPILVPDQTLVRRLPEPTAKAVESVASVTAEQVAVIAASSVDTFAAPPLRLVAPSRADLAEVMPVSGEQYRIRMLVDREWIAMLDKVKSIYSHSIPSGDPREVIARALRAAIDADAKRHDPIAVKARKSSRESDDSSRHIPAELERQVWARDGGCCVWQTETGICGSTWQLEIDHIVSIALGGKTLLENLRLLCRAHNQMHARQVFGAQLIEAKIAQSRI